ncbi:D-alanyl-D-alanine endopeptidase [Aliamphritea spongicola]|uniref:D-alanyl-D-alanine endopeptidase n=1 Tax=Aliamphritea spongicola TaxID=707589 RepID=UPI00196AD780|nr:D-alanyl-D-alanine endopeptidase [Aliamphritea spongicola]MBN3563331.1 D-alanyl-D-alanine endopeptidase [Aliamphritea spongicola]
MRSALILTILFFSACIQAGSQPSSEKLPQLASVSVAVATENESDPVLLKNADMIVPIASVTKIMTAMVILDAEQDLNEYITFTKADKEAINNYYSRIRIDSRLRRKDALRIALMSSENFASMSLATNYPGGSKAFIQAMNDKADSLGMTKTRFADSSGLSPDNVSTAKDLAKMALAAAKYPKLREFSTTGQFTANFKGPRYRLGYGNTNPLVHRSSWPIDITKTGYLDIAGRCLVMVTEVEGEKVAMVLLNSYGKRTPIGDAGRIKRWMTTGETGKISQNARNYQKKQLALYKEKLASQLASNES